MIGPIDLIEFRMTSNTAEHLAQLQYRVSHYNCLGKRSNASSSLCKPALNVILRYCSLLLYTRRYYR